MNLPLLQLDEIGHAYFGRTVLDRVSLSLEAGTVLALVGPSGCGKSTLVQIAAGLVEPVRGVVRANYRRHAMVFQEPRLLPWTTARNNIAYPLRLAGLRRPERQSRAEAAAIAVSLAREDLDKYPSELSGGMRQRTAIARALAIEPDFVYFDEPFTALDVALKRRMQDLVIEAARWANFAAVFVTHDLVEAVRVANRIAVLDTNGRGIAGIREVPLSPGDPGRSDAMIFATVQAYLRSDPLFAQIHNVDERVV